MSKFFKLIIIFLLLCIHFGCAPKVNFYNAARLCDTEIFNKALKKGKEINALDRNTGNNALHTAVLNNCPEIAALLIANGADPNYKNAEGLAPLLLYEGSHDDNFAIAKILIDNGADVNVVNEQNSRTVLMNAASHGNAKYVDFLLNRGAEKNMRDEEGFNAFMHACKSANVSVVKTLFSDEERVQRDIQGRTALMHAAIEGNSDILQFLLDMSFSISDEDSAGMTPLLHAVSNKHIEVTRKLLQAGADTEHKNKEGLNALYCIWGYVKIPTISTKEKELCFLLLENAAPVFDSIILDTITDARIHYAAALWLESKEGKNIPIKQYRYAQNCYKSAEASALNELERVKKNIRRTKAKNVGRAILSGILSGVASGLSAASSSAVGRPYYNTYTYNPKYKSTESMEDQEEYIENVAVGCRQMYEECESRIQSLLKG